MPAHPKLFINYRRNDHRFFVYALRTHLAHRFGADNVFMDIKIPRFRRFEDVLREKLEAADAVMMIVGPAWLNLLQAKARNPDETDYVQLELEIAQELGIPILPFMIAGGTPPPTDALPPTLKACFDLQAARIPDEQILDETIDDIAADIQAAVAYFSGQRPPQRTQQRTQPTSKPAILPAPFAWIEIPGGRVTLEEKSGFYGGGQTFNVGPFLMAKYPITNAQFARFIEAGGYHEQRFWTEAGWQKREENGWTAPRYWQDSKWNGAEQPVVGVSWYEAIAFCQWLSETTGAEITLPTETQWQYAAQDDDGRAYPWGAAWDASRCNTREDGPGKTTPVRQYEGQGDSPFGVVDMAGNVFEWCLTEYESGDNENISSTARRVLRGGSWNDNQYFARAACRRGLNPDSRLLNFGFRVVRPAPIN